MGKLKVQINIPEDIWDEKFEEIDLCIDKLSLLLRKIDERIVMIMEYDPS